MSSTAIATVITTIESLPEAQQNLVIEDLREYIEDIQDELQWDKSFQKTQQQLIAAAQKAKQEITEGQSQPLDYNQFRDAPI